LHGHARRRKRAFDAETTVARLCPDDAFRPADRAQDRGKLPDPRGETALWCLPGHGHCIRCGVYIAQLWQVDERRVAASNATSPEPSVERLSTTIGRKPGGIRSRIQWSAGASLRQGKITSTITAVTL